MLSVCNNAFSGKQYFGPNKQRKLQEQFYFSKKASTNCYLHPFHMAPFWFLLSPVTFLSITELFLRFGSSLICELLSTFAEVFCGYCFPEKVLSLFVVVNV